VKWSLISTIVLFVCATIISRLTTLHSSCTKLTRYKSTQLFFARVSVATPLAAAKLGRLVLSQFVVCCEQSRWKACVQYSRLRTPVQLRSLELCYEQTFSLPYSEGGSVAEWLTCWTQAQKGPGSNRSRDTVGYSLRQTAHTHCASVHQAT